MDPFVVVGGGPAGARAVMTLARAGEPVVLVSAEMHAPYDRTALSKKGLQVVHRSQARPHQERSHPAPQGPAVGVSAEEVAPGLWPDEPWRENVSVLAGVRATSLDVEAHRVRTADGREIPYRAVLLATGARPRTLDLPGAAGPGVMLLRDLDDTHTLGAGLSSASRLVVIGGGVIGLEVAATARTLGLSVSVVEANTQILSRGVPAPVAAWIADKHREHGVDLRIGARPVQIERSESGGAVRAVILDTGERLAAEVVLVGIGVVPCDELARAGGIHTHDGIVVDDSCRTSAPDVFAAGDVARMNGIRLEAYQAAGEQGEVAAQAMLGGDAHFTQVPWTWSDQFDVLMQSAGLPGPDARQLDLSTPAAALVLSFEGEGEGGVVVGACGAGIGPGIARPIRAAAAVIAARGTVNAEEVSATRGDLSALTALLRSAKGRT